MLQKQRVLQNGNFKQDIFLLMLQMYPLGGEVHPPHSGTQAEKLHPHTSLTSKARKGYTAKCALTLKAST